MDPPPTDGGIERDNFEEVKEGGPMHHCNLFDAEVTHKIAEAFLPGLASACIDNTLGGLFKSPGSVAVAIRKEMVDALIQRSETFVAEAVVLEGEAETEVPEHPFDIISDFIDDFASSKNNFFSRVSGWMLSDMREDKIDEFAQEMEINGFWMIDRRESVAQTLLKNVDFKDAFHCNKKFNTADELVEHLPQCRFRTIHCPNEGCDDQFSAGNSEIHDAVCPFKMLPCEQNCSEILMRRDMDRHCITDCPMKHVSCPFSSIGCASSIPRARLEQHKLENVRDHVLSILQSIHKKASTEDLKHRVDQLIELSSPEQLAKPQNVRPLTTLIKNLEAKLGPLEVMPKTTSSEEIPSQNEGSTDSPKTKEEHVESSNTMEVRTQPPPENKTNDSPIKHIDSPQSSTMHSPARTEEFEDSPTKGSSMQSPAKEQHLAGSSDGNDDQGKNNELMDSPTKDRTRELPAEENHPVESSDVAEHVPAAKSEEHNVSLDRESPSANDLSTGQAKMDIPMDSAKNDSTRDSPAEEYPVDSSTVAKDLADSPTKIEERKESSERSSLSGNDISTSPAKKDEVENKDISDPPAKSEV